MHTLIENNTLYIFSSEELMVKAASMSGQMRKMYAATFVMNLKYYNDRRWCNFIKDRSGFFNKNVSMDLELVLSLIKTYENYHNNKG